MAGLLTAVVALAASVDGKWVFETKTRNQKTGAEIPGKVTLVLKTAGGGLTGSVTTGNRRRDMTAEIKDATIEGNQVRFVTVNQTRKGEQKFTWTATVEGDELRGTRTRERAKRGTPFIAKRQN